MIETYPKIPRLSVKACPQKKPQVVEALLNVIFTVQISISAGGRIDASHFYAAAYEVRNDSKHDYQ
jgi:hypothetical protein